MFLRTDHGYDQAGGTVARSLVLAPPATRTRLDHIHAAVEAIDWTPDLGARIGSLEWWRGLASCAALLVGAWTIGPRLDQPLLAAVPRPLSGAEWDEARANSIAPLAWGTTTGRHMAASELVRPLAETPERPLVSLTATLGEGDDFADVLQRAGVGRAEAARAASLVGEVLPSGTVRPGTRIDLTLGSRPDKHVARPLERLAFRARFDLALDIARTAGALVLRRQPIAIDHTPLRVEGRVGGSLYRAVRAAGVPTGVAEAYVKALSTRMSIGSDVAADDRFDVVLERARAATGEVQLGDLLLAGLTHGKRTTALMRWGDDRQWYDADGTGAKHTGGLAMPVAGRISSTFGARWHPILHFMRMHEGTDIAAPKGSPIYAATDGIVSYAGWRGGYGNFVMLKHAAGLTSGYGHMSRIAVHSGAHVARGQVIGYVGSTGLSTGPHVHWEVRRNGRPVNPATLSFDTVARLGGRALATFKDRIAQLLAVKPAS